MTIKVDCPKSGLDLADPGPVRSGHQKSGSMSRRSGPGPRIVGPGPAGEWTGPGLDLSLLLGNSGLLKPYLY